jgi:hypothetical protein
VVVDGTGLANLPADGEKFVERSLIDQVARVVLPVPGEVGCERVRIHGRVLQESAELLGFVEGGLGKLAELDYEIVDWNWFYGCGHGVLPQSIALHPG